MNDIIQQIIDFADNAHGSQMRKYSPERYIVHPVRVMQMVKEYTNDITILTASILHDVLEDTQTTEDEIHHFLLRILNKYEVDRALNFVIELTDIYIKTDYPQWNREKRKLKEADRLEKVSAEAQTIKYADIIDNSHEIVEQDPGFAEHYLKECKFLLEKMNKGNQELHQKANEIIESCIQRLHT